MRCIRLVNQQEVLLIKQNLQQEENTSAMYTYYSGQGFEATFKPSEIYQSTVRRAVYKLLLKSFFFSQERMSQQIYFLKSVAPKQFKPSICSAHPILLDKPLSHIILKNKFILINMEFLRGYTLFYYILLCLLRLKYLEISTLTIFS